MDLYQGASDVAASPSGHPGAVPLNPKQIEAHFDVMWKAAGTYGARGEAYVWRAGALAQWRSYSEKLLAGAGG